MKVKEILTYGIVALVSLVLGIVLTLITTNLILAKSKAPSSLMEMFGLATTKPSSYVAKIGDYYLSTDDFNKEYLFIVDNLSAGDLNKKSLYLNDLSTKKAYLDNVINELVLVIDAYNKGYLSSSDWNTLSKISLRKSLADGFLTKQIDTKKIEVTDKEVEELYNKNREYFRQNNISAEKAEEFLKAQIRNQKAQQEVAKYIQSVRDKLQIEKLEDNVK